jgi:hypothetical protein
VELTNNEVSKPNFLVTETWSVMVEDLNSEITIFLESNRNVGLRILHSQTGYVLNYVDLPYSDGPDTEIVCSGSGAQFIDCCNEFLNSHPACDLVICPDSGGNGFYADSFCP